MPHLNLWAHDLPGNSVIWTRQWIQASNTLSMTTTNADRTKYIKRDYGSFVGKTIKEIRPLTKQECENMAWEYDYEDYAVVVIFTDGSGFIPFSDEEGNGAGFLAETVVK